MATPRSYLALSPPGAHFSVRLRTFAFLVAAGLAAGCAPALRGLENKNLVPATSPLPIDGLWKNAETSVVFRIESGRVYFHSGFNQSVASYGDVVMKDLEQIAAREYRARSFVFNKLTGNRIGWAPAHLTVDSSTSMRVVSYPIPDSVFGGEAFSLDLVSADDVDWFRYQLASERVVSSEGQSSSGTDRDQPASGEVSQGTCFAISPDGLVATAAHVIEGARKILVEFADGAFEARVLRSSVATDLALLQVQRRTEFFLTPTSGGYALGDPVYTIGFPAVTVLGTDPKYSRGTISALSGPGGDAAFLQVSVPTHPGNSGGPLVGDDGRLVGVMVGTAAVAPFVRETGTLPQNVNWAVKSGLLLTLLDGSQEQQPRRFKEDARTAVERSVCLVVGSPD